MSLRRRLLFQNWKPSRAEEFFSRRSRLPASQSRWTVSKRGFMHEMKDTVRALVRIGYDGLVYNTFRGHRAKERFEQEVRVLRHLEARGCPFVPRLLKVEPENLKIVTTNCGRRIEHLGEEHQKELFAELEQ